MLVAWTVAKRLGHREEHQQDLEVNQQDLEQRQCFFLHAWLISSIHEMRGQEAGLWGR